jgi:hypothetical protein
MFSLYHRLLPDVSPPPVKFLWRVEPECGSMRAHANQKNLKISGSTVCRFVRVCCLCEADADCRICNANPAGDWRFHLTGSCVRNSDRFADFHCDALGRPTQSDSNVHRACGGARLHASTSPGIGDSPGDPDPIGHTDASPNDDAPTYRNPRWPNADSAAWPGWVTDGRAVGN